MFAKTKTHTRNLTKNLTGNLAKHLNKVVIKILDGKQDEDARRGGDRYKVRGAGPGSIVSGMTAGGATRSSTAYQGAGLSCTVLGRTAGGATKSNTDKVVRSIKGGGRRATR